MIVNTRRGNVVIRARDKDGKRIIVNETNHRPYCFVETKFADRFNAVVKEDGYKGLYGEDLTKIVVGDSYQIKEVRDLAESMGMKTWEANLPFTNRVLVDRLLEDKDPIPNYEHRIWYLDCEWSPRTNKLRVIVVKDSFTQQEYVWFVNPELDGEPSEKYHKFGDYDYEPFAKGFGSERVMLIDFIKHMELQDPDVITGWYVVGADIKTIFERCNKNGINPSVCSPYRKINYQFKDWSQPIEGRLCIDLMVAFSKLWELKNGKLPGYKLDDVAQQVLGQKKVELPDGHDTYNTNLALYLHYCRQDVRLLPLLNERVNAIEHYLSLQHLVQCDIRTTPFITKMFTCLALQDRKFGRRIPTRPQFEKEDYEGADVMEVEPGLHKGVGILDIRAMYHSNAELHNISWETLGDEGGHNLYYKDCGNGVRFRQDEKGLLVRQMDLMTKLRNQYKDLMWQDPDNKAKWDTMQFACKSLVASMYGVCGDSRYGMYHPQIAGAITYTSRQTLNRLKTLAENAGFKVLYGHTDSVFCSIGSPTRGQELMRSINAEMHPIEVEFERWCESMVLMAKNRYAGRVSWTDGEFHEPKTYIKGIEMKQSRMPPIMKDTMKITIEGLLAGIGEEEITQNLKQLISDVINGKTNSETLCMKGKLERNLSEYKVLSGPSAGAAWANENLGKGYGRGSYFLVTLNESGKYMAFDDPSEIEDLYPIGYKHLAERFMVNKVEPYYELLGWDIRPLVNTMDGKGNLAWL